MSEEHQTLQQVKDALRGIHEYMYVSRKALRQLTAAVIALIVAILAQLVLIVLLVR